MANEKNIKKLNDKIDKLQKTIEDLNIKIQSKRQGSGYVNDRIHLRHTRGNQKIIN